MSEGELEHLAVEAWGLTAAAREALDREIQKRGLNVSLGSRPVTARREWRRPVTLRVFGNLQEALLAKSILESAGVHCFLADENMARLDSFMSTVVGGIKLWVDEGDAEAAVELLRLEIPREDAIETGSESKQPRCPHCQSPGISFESLNRRATYSRFIAGLLLWKRRRWKCESCGNEWRATNG